MPDPITGSTLYGVNQADKAADAQVDATNNASAAQMQMFYQNRRDQQPWMRSGRTGLEALMGLYGFQNAGNSKKPVWQRAADPMAQAQQFMQMDPGYQFRLQQGMQGLENSAAARGGLLSGNSLRALSQYNQGMASQEFGNIANRYAGLSGVGQNSVQNVGQMGFNTAQGVGQNMMAGGQARASGYMGQYNAVSNGLEQMMKLGGMAMGGGMGG